MLHLESGKPQRVVLDVASGKFTPIKVRGRIIATAPDLLGTLSRINEGRSSSLLFNDRGERAVLTVNAALKNRAEAPVKAFHFTYEGKKLDGWVVLPPAAKPGSRLPAVVSVYGGMVFGHMLSDDGDIYNPEIKMIENGQIQLQQPFWEASYAYRRNSPIFDVEKIDSPLLFLHGDLDLAVTGLPGAMRMYNAMVRAGKTAARVHYWGQSHVAESASAIRDQWSRITAWFGHYLKR